MGRGFHKARWEMLLPENGCLVGIHDRCPVCYQPPHCFQSHRPKWIGACGCLEGRGKDCPPRPREHRVPSGHVQETEGAGQCEGEPVPRGRVWSRRWGRQCVVVGQPRGKPPFSFSQALFWSQRVGWGGAGGMSLGRGLWESCLLVLTHLASSHPPEAGKVAEVPTRAGDVPELIPPVPATSQANPAGTVSPTPICSLCPRLREEPRLCCCWGPLPGMPSPLSVAPGHGLRSPPSPRLPQADHPSRLWDSITHRSAHLLPALSPSS